MRSAFRARKLVFLASAPKPEDNLVAGRIYFQLKGGFIAKLARRAQHPKIIAVLGQIAADEGRHAAHGWDVVEWCLEQGGLPVAHALSGAVRVLPERMHSSLPARAVDGAWEAWGIHGAALERDEYASARADVVQRVGRLICASRAA